MPLTCAHTFLLAWFFFSILIWQRFHFVLMVFVHNEDSEIWRVFLPSRRAVFIAGPEVVISVIVGFELQAGLLLLQGLLFLKRLAPAAQT